MRHKVVQWPRNLPLNRSHFIHNIFSFMGPDAHMKGEKYPLKHLETCSLVFVHVHWVESVQVAGYLRSGVHSGVPRRALWDAGAVVDDVFVAVTFARLTLAVELLAKAEADAAPALKCVETRWALVNAEVIVHVVAAGHTFARRVGLRAATQTLVVAALVVFSAGAVLAWGWAHCGEIDR